MKVNITQQKIVPCLWFDSQAEEAAKFYVDIFSARDNNSALGAISHYVKATEEVSGKQAGSVMTVDFILAGQKFMALNGGPQFKFSEAISFVITCADQDEVDYFWEKLTAGGEESVCGWLKDKFGLSWQVVPAALDELLSSKDAQKKERVMAVLLNMKKLDVAALQQAQRQS